MLPEELPAVHREYADGQIIDALNSVYGLRELCKKHFWPTMFSTMQAMFPSFITARIIT